LAAAIVGGSNEYGATVVNSTVGDMESFYGGTDYGTAGAPITSWEQSDIATDASGEVFLSDGKQFNVRIFVRDGEVTWRSIR
jgi:hypothetical protein